MNVQSIKNRLAAQGIDGEMLIGTIIGTHVLGGMITLSIMTWFYGNDLFMNIFCSLLGVAAAYGLVWFYKEVNSDRIKTKNHFIAQNKVSLIKI
jgi:Mg/Co/Ni transporter MgtE